MYKKTIILWLLFVPIAILNGILREFTYKNFIGDLGAHQLSTVIAISSFLTLSYYLLKKNISEVNIAVLLNMGLLLVILTILFEFGFGHYIDKASWEKLLKDYNFSEGRVWGLFLITELFTPLIIQKIVLKKD